MDKKVYDKIARLKKKNLGNNLDETAVLDLIERVTGNSKYRNSFIIKQIPEEKTGMDMYRVSDNSGKILIEATSGVAAAVAFNTYLKEKCHCYFGPITQSVNMPAILPKVGETIENKSVFLYRYFMNYVTYAYTCLYYKWEQYEKLTDWMLMAGINLLLNPVGHEIIWRDTLMELGYTAQEANDDICGAGTLPWQIMGNVSAFGGDIPEWWFEDQKEIGNRMTEKMRMFGGDVIRPAFYGKVPVNFGEKYPEANIYMQGDWSLAGERPPLIDTRDPMFEKFAEIYYRKTKEHFGKINYFGGDPFHEGGNTEGIDLPEYSGNLVKTMKKYSADGVWFFQGWSGNPQKEVLEGMKKEDVIVGFLSADRGYSLSTELFGDYPWMYMQIGNFGGVRRFTGNIPEFLNQPFEALSSPVNDMMIGIGMAMEGIETDEITYDVLASNSIREQPMSEDEFLTQFFTARYGYCNDNIISVYKALIENVYSLWERCAYKASKSSSLCTCPNLNVRTVGWYESKDDSPYPVEIMRKACIDMLKEYDKLKDNDSYHFDMMELCRQSNADYGWECIKKLKKAYNDGNKKEFERMTRRFMKLFDIQEAVVRTDRRCLLGEWIKRAKDYGRTETEKRIFEYNVKNLFTLWIGKTGKYRLRDYAHREYDGMLSGYYKKRWDAYLTLLSLNFNRKEMVPKINWTEHDFVFTLSTEKYRSKPEGDLKKAVEASIRFWNGK